MKKKPTKSKPRNPPRRRVSRIRSPKKYVSKRRIAKPKKPSGRAPSRKVQLPARRQAKRKPAKAKARKPTTRRSSKSVRAKQSRLIRKQQAYIKQLESQVTKLTRVAPSPFPTKREFAKARKTEIRGGAAPESVPDYPSAIVQHVRDLDENVEESGAWEESESYEDMFDFEWDDYDEDVGDEDEDSYGGDAAK